MARLPLVASRLLYAFATGVALLVALSDVANRETLGAYTYQVGIGSVAAIVLTGGLDRLVTRRVAAREIPAVLPRSIVLVRVVTVSSLLLAGVIFACLGWTALAATVGFVASRVLYADLESFWIASASSQRVLGVALALNGGVTALAIVEGVNVGSWAMTAGSAAGNLAGILVFVLAGRLPIERIALPGWLPEARNFGSSALIGVLYARADLFILLLVDVPLDEVAVYGVVTRAFDVAALIRGALSQQESRELAPMDLEGRLHRLEKLAARTALVTGGLAVTALILLIAFQGQWQLWLPESDLRLIGLAFCALPVFYSHLPTTAMVFADRRTSLLVRGSLVTCFISVCVKWLLIERWGVEGATISLGAVEYASCCTFSVMYGLSSWGRRGLVIIGTPLLASLVATVTFLIVYA